jgi:hypothetical protein
MTKKTIRDAKKKMIKSPIEIQSKKKRIYRNNKKAKKSAATMKKPESTTLKKESTKKVNARKKSIKNNATNFIFPEEFWKL